MTDDLNGKRKWTVRELIKHLESMPQDRPVTLLDADTNYVIELFSVTDCHDPDEVTFFPCDYVEMRK
jgi:hypothetical protein